MLKIFTFLCILSLGYCFHWWGHTYAVYKSNAQWRRGSCQNLHLQHINEDVHLERFFDGIWFVRGSYGNYLPEMLQHQPQNEDLDEYENHPEQIGAHPPGTCSAIEYLMHGNQIIQQYIQLRPGSNQYESLIGIIPAQTIHGPKYEVDYIKLEGLQIQQDNENVRLPYVVLDTDYDNYAVVYSCKQEHDYKLELLLALTRERGTMQFDGYIQGVLSQLDISRGKWVEEQYHSCPNDLPLLYQRH